MDNRSDKAFAEKIRSLRADAETICRDAIAASVPDVAIRRALQELPPREGKMVLVAIGKAAWQAAKAARDVLGERIDQGIVITKYGHGMGPLGKLVIREAGHPVPDENSIKATREALEMVRGLNEKDLVLFLVSGGGSALFEAPLLPLSELEDITRQLLASGADITQVNLIRKRLSAVKGGRFGQICAPARVYAVLISDVIGDAPDVIASGPAYPDSGTPTEALEIVKRYDLTLSPKARQLLTLGTPKELLHVTTVVVGSVTELCRAAANRAEQMGYTPVILTDCLQCEAREAGRFMSAIARTSVGKEKKKAYIVGGETVVHLTGKGKGGRNQELALAAAKGMRDLPAALASVGSDGTDGPTDAAGGIVDGMTAERMAGQGISIDDALRENDSYHALEKCDGLVFTGPTGTNVNDVCVLLI